MTQIERHAANHLITGGGIIGCFIADHLAKSGEKDVQLLGGRPEPRVPHGTRPGWWAGPFRSATLAGFLLFPNILAEGKKFLAFGEDIWK